MEGIEESGIPTEFHKDGLMFFKHAYVNTIHIKSGTPYVSEMWGVIKTDLPKIERSHDHPPIHQSLLEYVNVLEDPSYDLNSIKKVYIHTSALLPRYRLKQVKEKYNFSVVRKAEDADHIVINSKTLAAKLCESRYQHLYLKSDIILLLESSLFSPSIEMQLANIASSPIFRYNTQVKAALNVPSLTEVLKYCKELPVDYIAIDWAGNMIMHELRHMSAIKDLKQLTDKYNGASYTVISDEQYEFIHKMKDKVVLDDSILQSNLGASVFTHDDYLFIDKLLRNTDETNIDLGLNMMANSDFAANAHYLMLLVKDHYEKHRYQKYVKSVSFKSLMSFLKTTGWPSYDDIIETAQKISKFEGVFRELILERFKTMYTPYVKTKYIKNLAIELDEEAIQNISNLDYVTAELKEDDE